MSEIHSGTIEERVKKCIHEVTGIAIGEINTDSGIVLDSIELLETVMAVEDEFNIEIYDEDAWAFTTVQSVIDHVTAKVAR